MLGTILSIIFILSAISMTLIGIGAIISAAIMAIKDRSFVLLAIITVGLIAIISKVGLIILGII